MLIWKFPCPLTDEVHVEIPADATFLHFGHDPGGMMCIWIAVDPEADLEERVFYVRGTGHEVAEGLVHLGSVVDSMFVWHLFEEAPV